MKTKHGTVTSIDKITVGTQIDFCDMQLSASNSNGDIYMAQFSFEDDNGKSKYTNYKISPGSWRITPKDGLIEWTLSDEVYFETGTVTEILRHMRAFLNKKEVYKKFGLDCKRGVLTGGIAGCGKSSAIRHLTRTAMKEDPKICILRIDSDQVDTEILIQMFMNANPDDVSCVILILEDIGGANLSERVEDVDKQLLNFLDGNGSCFKVPTLIVATTNYLDTLTAVLTDRPGRFDVVLQVKLPTDPEVFQIVEGVAQRCLSDDEKRALAGKGFTPAYCIEALVRSELYDIPVGEAVEQLKVQRQLSQDHAHAQKNKRVGFNQDEF
jgi:hypothetical protein